MLTCPPRMPAFGPLRSACDSTHSAGMRRSFTALIAGLIAGPVGCQDYRFEQLCPETITEQEVTRAAAEPTPADILFVVDNSGSMADEQENLAANFEFFGTPHQHCLPIPCALGFVGSTFCI